MYLIAPYPVYRDEYEDYCKVRNSTTFAVKTEEEFNKITSALLRWANISKEMRQVLENEMSLLFWTSGVYSEQVSTIP